MARNILVLLFFLSVSAALLVGINIGKKIGTPQYAEIATNLMPTPTVQSTDTPVPTLRIYEELIPKPEESDKNSTSVNSDTQVRNVNGVSSFSDRSCGFSFTIPGSYIRQETVNQESKIFLDQDNPDAAIAIACADSIPRPPVSEEFQETITLDGQAATLYHDRAPNGRPRDEIIITHPVLGHEIIIAGFGSSFRSAISSFIFIR